MKNFLKINGRQRGFAMTEVILAIVIAVAGIVGGIVLFGNAQLGMNTSDASRAAVNISSEARALKRTAPSFAADAASGSAALSAATLVAAGGVSPNLLEGTTIVLPYDGTVALAPNATDNQTFDMTLTWAPGSKASALCSRLAQPPQNGGVGPMGTDYVIAAATDCANTTNPVLVATYRR